MNKKNKFTTIPSNINIHDDANVSEFIKSAAVITKNTSIPDTNNTTTLPWGNLDDLEKSKGVNLRMTKADLAKLNFVSENTPFSIQKYIYQAMKKELDKTIEEILSKMSNDK